ncbi:MAG: aspartate 1-decarboxylase [Candidatus Nanopelagicales bacterium]|nr:aspartate 1-decarboxylase [Candidatus Nanopelagicales bacterium]MDZ4249444.1 aspartate 1-decarboxylase [Candidatus Nanopelagicales bacterium]
MRRRMMKSKIHRATVTDAHLEYVGSVSLDPRLMTLADILVGEQVQILDIDNGSRFETYAIEGRPGECCVNGAAARLVHPGDKVIILTYADYEEAELVDFASRVVHVDELNVPIAAAAARDVRAGAPAVETTRPRRGDTVRL